MLCRLTRCLRLANAVTSLRSSGLHTTCCTHGVREPGQNKLMKKHSQYYDDFWSRDLEAWSDNNKMLYPPSKPGEPHRPAEIYHGRAYIRYSPKKLHHACNAIRNMNVDEAIAQLGHVGNKAARIIIEVLLEAQELAVQEHNVEFKSNLHIAHSSFEPAGCRKIIKYHGKGYAHMNRSRFTHFFVMLREGQAPGYKTKVTAYGAAVEYLNSLRMRTIQDGL